MSLINDIVSLATYLTWPTLREPEADSYLEKMAADIAAVQTQYLNSRGSYWQGLKTHATNPRDGEKLPHAAPINTPTNEADNWNANVLPATSPISFTVNVYDGPHGKGYEVVGELELRGVTVRRVINVGPETWRDTAEWFEVLPAFPGV